MSDRSLSTVSERVTAIMKAALEADPTYRSEGMGHSSIDGRSAVDTATKAMLTALEQVGWMSPECWPGSASLMTRRMPEQEACSFHGHPWRRLYVIDPPPSGDVQGGGDG